jgi:hypothetical protein
MHVARQAIELGDDYRDLPLAGAGEGGGELRAAFDCVGALAGVDLNMFGDDLEALRGGEAGDRLAALQGQASI